jgi:hypothetical protein
VLDKRGIFVNGLPPDAFKVYEDKVLQKLSVAKQEDVPVSMGLVIDNSGSMFQAREGECRGAYVCEDEQS